MHGENLKLALYIFSSTHWKTVPRPQSKMTRLKTIIIIIIIINVNITNVTYFNASLPPTTKCSPHNIIPPMLRVHFHVILLLSEGQAGEAWKTSNTAILSLKSGSIEGKSVFVLYLLRLQKS